MHTIMAKHKPHHSTHRSLPSWYFLVVAAIFGLIAVASLRSNYSHMVTLRNKVYAADKSGQGVDQALQDLRAYVGHHMNTSLSSGENGVYPPIQLKYTYARLVKAKSEQAKKDNARVYTEAQDYCEKKIPTGFHGLPRVDCVEQYVEQHGVSTDSINPSLYQFDFYTPRWSPDLAGWSLVASVLSGVVFICLAATRKLRRLLP